MYAAIVLTFGGMVLAVPTTAGAQSADQKLLSTFCAPANIKGSTCKNAKGYRSGQVCQVKLGKGRYSGKFLTTVSTMLVVSYDSECEPHATNFGGSVIFEQIGDDYNFKGYQPGYKVNDCITIARNTRQDRLICVTGFMGQGHLETSVVEMLFTQDFSKRIKLSTDNFISAEDSTGAYGSNTVDCKTSFQYFGLSKLGAGPRSETVTLDISYADSETIRTACKGGFPAPKEVSGDLAAGEAYVPTGYEKNAKFVLDLATRTPVRETEFGKIAPAH